MPVHHWIRRVFLWLPCFWMSAGLIHGADYVSEVKPLLRARCFACHGALKQKAKLRLDTAASIRAGGESGPAIRPGNPGDSLLMKRVLASGDERMPPEHEGEPFQADQISVLREWIAAGAHAPENESPEQDPMDHWAFKPVKRPSVPGSLQTGWIRNSVDAFVARQHQLHGLTPQPEAPREILVRRLHLDLIGLPPSPTEFAEAMADASPDWYERRVDRLLDDPRHGERWARHWMDIWRYSDPWGLGDQLRNSQKHIWHWRDWIVESLNGDLPFDEMIRSMLAADELYPEDLGRLRATGFLARNWFLFNRNQWMEETVEHVGKGFLGLTLNCAKCHDHKYDPIAQTDFYRMRAFFEPYHVRLDVLPGTPDLESDGLPRVFDGHPDMPTYRFIRGQESQPDKSAPVSPGVPSMFTFHTPIIRTVQLPEESWRPELRRWVVDDLRGAARRKVHVSQEESQRLARDLAVALRQEADLLDAATGGEAREKAAQSVNSARAAFQVGDARRTLHQAELELFELRAAMLLGAAGDAGAPASRSNGIAAERRVMAERTRLAVAEVEKRLSAAPETGRPAIEKELSSARENLAKAIQSLQSPVGTNDSFPPLAGARWTPTRFFNSTADDPLVGFPPTSTGRRRALAEWITHPGNPLTARVAVNHVWLRHFGAPLVETVFEFGRKGAPPTQPELLDWLAAELMSRGWSLKQLHRIMVTSSTYRMSTSLAGADSNRNKDPDNRHLWRRTPVRLEAQAVRDSILSHAGVLETTLGGPPVPPAAQDSSRRRSLYFHHSNNERNLFLTVFDEAAVKECYRRDQSIVPQQALAMSNSKLVHDHAPAIAARLGSRALGRTEREFVATAFLSLLGIRAGDEEQAASAAALAGWRDVANGSGNPHELQNPEESARIHFIRALLNHNDFVTLR